MTTAIAITTPQYLPSLYTEADIKALNDEFGGGLTTSVSFPRIGMKGTRFAIHDDGTEQVIPQSTIDVVIVRARPSIDKTWYASKFDPNSDEKSGPDCFSKDGQRPDPSSAIKQSEVCANCPMNAFGSGQDANGNPSKGKACADTKQLAIFAAGKVYGFKVTPASLKAYNTYLKTLGGYNLSPPVVVTRLGFDPNFSFPVLTFEYAGTLDQAQAAKVSELRASQGVEDICGSGKVITPAPVQQVAAPTPVQQVAAPVEAAPVFGAFAPAPEEAPKTAPPKRVVKEKVTPIVQPAEPMPAQNMAGPTEADIMAKLGL